jgi:Leucine-rich repeat (LRR) protein
MLFGTKTTSCRTTEKLKLPNLSVMDLTSNDNSVITYGEGVWIVIEEGELKGMTMIADRQSGDVVGISARSCKNEDKRNVMPSLKEHSSKLKVVDLHNYRYMKTLHSSIGELPNLERLILSRCDNLQTLPPSIGNLHNLVEVRSRIMLRRFFGCTCLTKKGLNCPIIYVFSLAGFV